MLFHFVLDRKESYVINVFSYDITAFFNLLSILKTMEFGTSDSVQVKNFTVLLK